MKREALPFLVALIGIAVFSVMDAVMKAASIAFDVYSVLLYRSLIGAALVLPAWWLTGDKGASGRWPSRDTMKVHLLRAVVVVGMAYLFFSGLKRLPLAEGIALSFFAPLIAIYLAGLFLKERVRLRSVGASLLGLVGVAVIAGARLGYGPRDEEAAIGVAQVLGSAVLYAGNIVIQRRQAQIASPLEVAFFQNLLMGAILALGAAWLARPPAPDILLQSALVGGLATLALLLLTWAYARAEAQVLVATEYTAFIWAALLGWLMFGERVTAATIAGVVLIVAACWIAARKRTEQTAL